MQAQQGSFEDKTTLEAFYHQIPSLLSLISSPTADIPEHRFLRASPILRLLSRFGRNALSLLKLLLLEKKVVIYGIPVGETCDIIVALTSLLPLHNEKHDQVPFIRESCLESMEGESGALTDKAKADLLKPIQYNMDELEYSHLKLPLRVAPFTFISGSVALNQADWLCGLKSFFIGSSNALFALNKQVLELDATFDATTAQFTMYSSDIANALKLTPEDAAFIDFVINKIVNGGSLDAETTTTSTSPTASSPPLHPTSASPSSQSPGKRVHDDPFADFLLVDAVAESSSSTAYNAPLSSLSHSSSSSCASFSSKTATSATISTFTPGTGAIWQSKENWVRTMFARYVKALLAGASTQVTGVTQSRVDAYGGHFLLDWQTTKNYRFWRTQIDVRLIHADPTYNNMSHPGFSLPNTGGPTTLVGKGIQTVKGSLNTLSSTTTSFVYALGNAWNSKAPSSTNASAATENDVWGMDFGASLSSPETGIAGSTPAAPIASTSISPPSTPSVATFSPAPASPAPQQQQHATPTRAGIGGFFDSVKQKISSPFARTDRAAAQFEPVVLDGRAPTVVQPAQLAAPSTPANASKTASSVAPATPNGAPTSVQQRHEEEDLLGF